MRNQFRKEEQAMNSLIQKAKSVLTISIVMCATTALYAQVQPDNSAVNQRDRNASEPTADQQKMNATDRQLSASIRKQIVQDKSLSTYAHNIKIISQNGEVTLKGPVKSEDERRSILAKARATTGRDDKVHDEISVKQ
jgi:hyperosmotically inducible periplasmic protein